LVQQELLLRLAVGRELERGNADSPAAAVDDGEHRREGARHDDALRGFWIASRVCYFTFWRYAHEELKKKDDEDDPNISGKYIIVAYALQLVLCGDLAHYYLEAWMGGSLSDRSTKRRSELEL